MLFGRFRILGKLALLVVGPLVGVVALSVPLVLDRVHDARDAEDTADVVALANEVGTALQELQEERLLSVGFMFGLTGQPELVVQTAKVKDHIAQIRNSGRALPPDLRKALALASGLDRTRATVLNGMGRPAFVIGDFTSVITPIINSLALGGEADLGTATGRQIYALDTTLRSDDLVSQAAGLLTAAVVTKDPGLVTLFTTKLIELQAIGTQAEQYFTPEQYTHYQFAQAAFTTRIGANFLAVAATDPNKAVTNLTVETLYPSLRSAIVLGGFLEKRIAADVHAGVTKGHRDATRAAYLIAALSLLLLVAALSLSMAVARAVARPLRRLTASADRIARAAETELQRVADDDADHARPVQLDPVDVAAHDEIGDLARAFNRVQTTAAQLVERQVAGRRNVAQMLGHVGRRTQNLVGRQLALIDQLERRETDTDRLRELYRLDHISNRLRRNAGSLVVLSGGAGTNDHLAPMHLADVVRLALGEIEDYTRVDVDVPEELTVLPAVIADLTLLLAELMENATAFSPPHTRVTVTGSVLGGGARIEVVDHGLGLSPERLAEENARLTRRERLDLAPSEVLGLFVVGRLARRHGLGVSLHDTADGGTTARVELKSVHVLAQPEVLSVGGAAPIRRTLPTGSAAESAPRNNGIAVRLTPDGQLPFDASALGQATRTLASGRSWNAFAPVRASMPALAAGATALPALEAGPVHTEPAVTDEPAVIDEPAVTDEPAVIGEPAAAPATADAAAARDLVEAFQAGVTRATSDVIEAPVHQPLARRTPGATLQVPALEPPPPAVAAKPMNPDEARELIEQFENGVALALREAASTQPEGQQR